MRTWRPLLIPQALECSLPRGLTLDHIRLERCLWQPGRTQGGLRLIVDSITLVAGAQQGAFLGVKGLTRLGDEPMELPGGDLDAVFAELLEQQRLGEVGMVVLIEDVGAQCRVEVTTTKLLRQLPAASRPLASPNVRAGSGCCVGGCADPGR